MSPLLELVALLLCLKKLREWVLELRSTDVVRDMFQEELRSDPGEIIPLRPRFRKWDVAEEYLLVGAVQEELEDHFAGAAVVGVERWHHHGELVVRIVDPHRGREWKRRLRSLTGPTPSAEALQWRMDVQEHRIRMLCRELVHEDLSALHAEALAENRLRATPLVRHAESLDPTGRG